MENQDDLKPSRLQPGLQPGIPGGVSKGTLKKPERPRLVIYVEPSIFHEMHELAYKNGRSVSRLGQLAMVRLLSDFAEGRLEIDPEYTTHKEVGRA